MSGSLAKKLHAKRKERKLTQEQMAEMIGVTLRTVQRWEKNVVQPSKLARDKITKALALL